MQHMHATVEHLARGVEEDEHNAWNHFLDVEGQSRLGMLV